MPLIQNSDYQRPFFLFNRHLETMVPSAIRSVKNMPPHEVISIHTADGDFLTLDFYKNDSNKILIFSHGLEGDSKRGYALGMTKLFHANGWNVIAWNYRGCSEQMNKTTKFYHSGATFDLHEIVKYAEKLDFESICLAGVSLGGNLTLKYLGEHNSNPLIKAAAVFSVPLDLAGCSGEIDKPHNIIYLKRFLSSLKEKLAIKASIMELPLNGTDVQKITTIYDFDDLVTAPLHGFDNADHYYQASSSIHFIEKIKIPTLVVNAANDPFLSASCFDTTNFESSDKVYFEMPKFGGHVGFSTFANHGIYWSEQRALDFISQHMNEL